MTMQRIGGLAALICAATYIFGFTLLVTVFAESGFGTNDIDAAGVVRFTVDNQALMITWFTVIYVLNALALAVLVVALASRLRAKSADWATMTLAFGLIWTTLVLGAGMIGNVTTETMAAMAPNDFDSAVQTWEALHVVELGLGGGNEIAGGVWVLCVSLPCSDLGPLHGSSPSVWRFCSSGMSFCQNPCKANEPISTLKAM